MGAIGISITVVVVVAAILAFALGIRIVRPVERGLVERFGKYNRFAGAGFNYVIPLVEKVVRVNITEQMVDAQQQQIITADSLNAKVDAQVYFKVKEEEDEVKKSQYKIADYERQIVQIARSTLRNIIGDMTLKDANKDRNKINDNLLSTLQKETLKWGIDIVRTELKEIEPPEDVQESMNQVVKANNEKVAAEDLATANETKADGERRASVKLAEGEKKAAILQAEGEAEAIKQVADATAAQIEVVNKSIVANFKDKAVDYKRLEVTQASLERNAKVVLTEKGISPVLVLGDSGSSAIPIPFNLSKGKKVKVNPNEVRY